MNRLLFFDIDGTLAMHGKIPPGNVEALAQLKRQGDATFVCTGRPVFYAKALFGSLVSGYVACNGRYTCYDGGPLFSVPLTQKERRFYQQQIDLLGGGILFLGENACYPYHLNDKQQSDVQNEYGPARLRPYEDACNCYGFDLYYTDLSQRDAYIHTFQEQLIINDHGGAGSCDCSVYGHDKGNAIHRLMEHFGVDADHTYAFGDGYNDQAMFRPAGHRIAMGNAVKPLKEKATYITDDFDRDGIRKALRHEGILL